MSNAANTANKENDMSNFNAKDMIVQHLKGQGHKVNVGMNHQRFYIDVEFKLSYESYNPADNVMEVILLSNVSDGFAKVVSKYTDRRGLITNDVKTTVEAALRQFDMKLSDIKAETEEKGPFFA